MEISLARITVQHAFCMQCMDTIQMKMMEVQDISNVRVYPQDALVVFNFKSAYQISEALNTLSALGYPPAGDELMDTDIQMPCCACAA